MKSIFYLALTASSLLFFQSCMDNSKQIESIQRHMEEEGLTNLKLSHSMSAYIDFLQAKTNSKVDITVNSIFMENTDSIVDFLTINLIQESLDTNHSNIEKSELLSRIAKDIKPLMNSLPLIEGLTILQKSESEMGGVLKQSSELKYESAIQAIPDGAMSNYQIHGDTINFEDYFYNDQIAYKGQLINYQRTGYWEYWHANGQKKKEGKFENNEKVGPWKYWSATGVELQE